jgi:hypothetical protein
MYCTLSQGTGRLHYPQINTSNVVRILSIGQSVTGGAGDVNMPLFIAATIFQTAADLGTDIPEDTAHIREAEDALAATRSFSFYSFSSSFSFSFKRR